MAWLLDCRTPAELAGYAPEPPQLRGSGPMDAGQTLAADLGDALFNALVPGWLISETPPLDREFAYPSVG